MYKSLVLSVFTVVQPSPQSISEHFHHPQKKHIPCSLPLSIAPGHTSTFCLWICLFWTFPGKSPFFLCWGSAMPLITNIVRGADLSITPGAGLRLLPQHPPLIQRGRWWRKLVSQASLLAAQAAWLQITHFKLNLWLCQEQQNPQSM